MNNGSACAPVNDANIAATSSLRHRLEYGAVHVFARVLYEIADAVPANEELGEHHKVRALRCSGLQRRGERGHINDRVIGVPSLVER